MRRKPSPIQVKILDLLRLEAPRSFNPKTIALLIKIPVPTVRVLLRRMARAHMIGQDLRGLYRSIFTLDDLLRAESPELQIHGLVFNGKVINIKQGSLFCYLLESKSRPASGNRKKIILPFEGRDLRIMLSENSTIEIFLKSSKYPINYSLFEQLIGYLKSILQDAIDWPELRIVEIGLGRDFKTWRLDGIQSIKIKEFRNAWIQIYQHGPERDTRLELHLHDRITLTDALNILKVATEPLYQAPALQDLKQGYL